MWGNIQQSLRDSAEARERLRKLNRYQYDLYYGDMVRVDEFIKQVHAPSLMQGIENHCKNNPNYYKSGNAWFTVEGDFRVYGRPVK